MSRGLMFRAAVVATLALLTAAGAAARQPLTGSGSGGGDGSHPAVVGGANAPRYRFPYQVAVGYDSLSCGGTLVQTATPEVPVVVTAAHCIESDSTVKNTFAVIGGYDTWTDNKNLGGGTKYKLKAIIVHPEYNTDLNVNDIAVLILKKTPKSSDSVQAIPMATAAETTAAAAKTWLLSGWGQTSLYANGDGEFGNLPPNLQYGKLNWLQPSDPMCLNSTVQTTGVGADVAAAKLICGYGIPSFDGGNPPRQGDCFGDSGGPLTLNVGLTPSQDPIVDGSVTNDRLAGIVSYGARGCGLAGYPSVYTRASAFIDWVNQQAAPYAKKRRSGRKGLP